MTTSGSTSSSFSDRLFFCSALVAGRPVTRLGSNAFAAWRSALTVKVEQSNLSAISRVESPRWRSRTASSWRWLRARRRSARDDLEHIAVAHPLLDQELRVIVLSPGALPAGALAPAPLCPRCDRERLGDI